MLCTQDMQMICTGTQKRNIICTKTHFKYTHTTRFIDVPESLCWLVHSRLDGVHILRTCYTYVQILVVCRVHCGDNRLYLEILWKRLIILLLVLLMCRWMVYVLIGLWLYQTLVLIMLLLRMMVMVLQSCLDVNLSMSQCIELILWIRIEMYSSSEGRLC